MTEKKEFSPGEIAYIKDIIKRKLNLVFSELFARYSSKPEFFSSKRGKKVTEKDLINEIVFEGKVQLGNGADFEKIVVAGTSSIAASLDLL
jgi:hypothetical protein